MDPLRMLDNCSWPSFLLRETMYLESIRQCDDVLNQPHVLLEQVSCITGEGVGVVFLTS